MSFEAEQQNTDSTEAVPGENNHDYLLKQGKGLEKKDFQDNKIWWPPVKYRRQV